MKVKYFLLCSVGKVIFVKNSLFVIGCTGTDLFSDVADPVQHETGKDGERFCDFQKAR
jgi:hypothetical protein